MNSTRARICRFLCLILVLGVCTQGSGQQDTANAPLRLLDHLAGKWAMTGTLGGKPTTHDVEAEWILNREYLHLHEVSRKKKANGAPVYEAIVFIGWDPKAQQFACLWLDSTEAWDFTAPGIMRGKPIGTSIPLVFTVSPSEAFHTTFIYQENNKTWRLLIEDVTNGKSNRFADVRLTPLL